MYPFVLTAMGLFSVAGAAVLWHKKTQKKLQQKALKGDPKAQYSLGMSYYKGKHLPQSDTQSFLWFSKAAQQGYVPAMNALAGLYNAGRGCEKNPQQAFRYYAKAAETGDFEGRINLAVCHLQGIGTQKDEQKGLSILEKAAQDKSPLAQTLLGHLYEKGTGSIVPSQQQALHYYLLAAQQGEPIAKKRIAQIQQDILQQYRSTQHGGKK